MSENNGEKSEKSVHMKRGSVKVDIQTKSISIGVDMDGKGRVKRMSSSSVFLGILFTNDLIISVCDKPVQTTADFFNTVRNAIPGTITVVFDRDEAYEAKCKTLPARAPGTELFEVDLTWRSGGNRIGMLIHRDFEGRVTVAVVEDGGAASKYVKPGDYLMKVNNVDIKDRELARKHIMESINKLKKVSITVERPKDVMKSAMIQPSVIVQPSMIAPAEPKSAAEPKSGAVPDKANASIMASPTVMGILAAPPPATITINAKGGPKSVMSMMGAPITPAGFTAKPVIPLAEDVLKILKEKEFFYKEKPTVPSCMVKNDTSSASSISTSTMAPITDGTASLSAEKAPEHQINFDPSPKELQITPKRVGS